MKLISTINIEFFKRSLNRFNFANQTLSSFRCAGSILQSSLILSISRENSCATLNLERKKIEGIFAQHS